MTAKILLGKVKPRNFPRGKSKFSAALFDFLVKSSTLTAHLLSIFDNVSMLESGDLDSAQVYSNISNSRHSWDAASSSFAWSWGTFSSMYLPLPTHQLLAPKKTTSSPLEHGQALTSSFSTHECFGGANSFKEGDTFKVQGDSSQPTLKKECKSFKIDAIASKLDESVRKSESTPNQTVSTEKSHIVGSKNQANKKSDSTTEKVSATTIDSCNVRAAASLPVLQSSGKSSIKKPRGRRWRSENPTHRRGGMVWVGGKISGTRRVSESDTISHAIEKTRVLPRKKGNASKGQDLVVETEGRNSPPSRVRWVRDGIKVIVVDEARKVFVVDNLVSTKSCDLIRAMAEEHCLNAEARGAKEKSWRTLYTYTKMDVPCGEVKNLAEDFTNNIMTEVTRIVGEMYGKVEEASKLRSRSYKEPHLLKYQAVSGLPHHTGVEMHYDGCDITWQLMLTHHKEYEGGGTYLRALRKTVKLRKGQILVHPGELYHKGVDIRSGVRMLVVCFMDGFDPKIVDDSRAEEDDESYEQNCQIY